MRNLLSPILAAAFMAAATQAAAQDLVSPGLACGRQVLRAEAIVRVDELHKRIFAVIKRPKQAELTAQVEKLTCCLDKGDWAQKWSLSVFASQRIAGYKDDPAIIPFHKNNEWAKGYLAEYDAATHTLTMRPATVPKVIDLSARAEK